MRRQQTQSVSLFPFLAVLVCAMGALILLLLVTTRRIRSNVIQQAQVAQVAQLEVDEPTDPLEFEQAVPLVEEPQFESLDSEAPQLIEPVVEPPELALPEPQAEPIVVELAEEPVPLPFVELQESQLAPEKPPAPPEPQKPVVDPNVELNRKIARLEKLRDQMQSQIAAQQKRVGVGKSHVLDQERELKQSQADQKTLAERRQRALARMRRMQEDEKSLTSQIQELRGAIQNATVAAPVETKFTIAAYDGRNGTARQPILIECTNRGFRFIPEDVSIAEADLRGFSAGFNPLLTGVRSLIDHTAAQTEEEQPYVLLVVRPSGALAFYSAKKLLKNLRQPFGYELLDDDFELQEPEVDPVAQTNLRRAVAKTISERSNLMQALRSETPGFGRHHSARDVPRGREPALTGAGRPMRIGRNGTVYLDEEPDSIGGRIAGDPENEFGFGGSPQRGQPNGQSRRQPGNPFEQPASGGTPFNGERDGGAGGFGNLASTKNRNSSQPGSGQGGTDAAGTGGGVGAEGIGRGSGGPMQDGVFLRPVPGRDGNGTSGANPQSAQPFNGSGQYGATGQSGVASQSRQRNSSQNGQRSGEPGGGGSQIAAGRNGSQSAAGSNGSGQRGGPNSQANQNSGQQTQTGQQAQDGQQGAGSSSSFPNFNTPEAPRGQLTQQRSKPAPEKNPFESPAVRSPWSGSKRAWGIPGQRGSIGFERVVRVTAHSDFVQVADQKILVVDPENRKSLTTRVLTAIDDQAKTWGQPSSGFYWVPLVKFAVQPNGNDVYRRVATPLRELGLTVETVSQHSQRGVR